jgi:hypothetical protein
MKNQGVCLQKWTEYFAWQSSNSRIPVQKSRLHLELKSFFFKVESTKSFAHTNNHYTILYITWNIQGRVHRISTKKYRFIVFNTILSFSREWINKWRYDQNTVFFCLPTNLQYNLYMPQLWCHLKCRKFRLQIACSE